MKKIFFLVIIIMFNYNNPVISLQKIGSPLILINDCGYEECGCVSLTFFSSEDTISGLTFYYNIDTNKYKNKKLKYLIDDLSNDFKLLGSKVFQGYERGEGTNRNSFEFFYKYNDTTMLVVDGCINSYNSFETTDDEIEKIMIKDQKSYAVTFYLIDVKKYYLDDYRNKFSTNDFNPDKFRDIAIIRMYYWNQVKDLIKNEK
jgi:hypothetical protein